MRRFVVLLLAALLLLCSCAQSGNPVLQPESYLTGWYVDEGEVYIVCHLFVMCENPVRIAITADSPEDRGGLLMTGELTAYNEDMSSDVFELHRGRNEFIAVFVGIHGTGEEMADYHVPDNIKITVRD